MIIWHSTFVESRDMATYLAHYQSPAAADVRGSGFFEFESNARAGSRENQRDARLRMLELFGKDSASWTIDKVDLQKAKTEMLGGQLELDFRPEKKPRKRKPRKDYR